MDRIYLSERNRPIDIIYILGAGHCGSTLLSLCFDKHSSVKSLSEIITLNRKKPGWSGVKNALEDKFWSQVDHEMFKEFEESIFQVPFDLSPSLQPDYIAIQRNKMALKSILNVSKKKIICDASKDAKRLDVLLGSKLFNVKVIYLVRDGRGIVNSYRRKYGSWFPGWYNLTRTDISVQKLKSKYGINNWLTVRYEDMATDIKGTLEKICKFADINFEITMTSPDTSNFNGLGGNKIMNKPIEGIYLDLKWKNEMSSAVRFFTSILVSRFNKRYGYSN